MWGDEDDWDFDAAAEEDASRILLEDSEMVPPPPEMEEEIPPPVLPLDKMSEDLANSPVVEPVATTPGFVVQPITVPVAEPVAAAGAVVAGPIAVTSQLADDPASPDVKAMVSSVSKAQVHGAPPAVTPGPKHRHLKGKHHRGRQQRLVI